MILSKAKLVLDRQTAVTGCQPNNCYMAQTLGKVFIIAVFLSAFPSFAFSGTMWTLEFVGFSKDGKYLAFEQHGPLENWSGEGSATGSEFLVINVEKNEWAEPPIKGLSQKEDRDKISAVLAKYGIVKGNKGQQILKHYPTDIGVNPRQARFSLAISNQGGSGDLLNPNSVEKDSKKYFSDPHFELKLEESAARNKYCQSYAGTKFNMSIRKFSKTVETTKTLQKDSFLPDSRHCAFAYRIEEIYWESTAKHLAVFLRVISHDFEGDDHRFMVVTGGTEF